MLVIEYSMERCMKILAAVKEKPGKCSGLNGNRTQDICNKGAVLYQLSYQANWELATLWVRMISDADEVTSFSAVLRRCPIYLTNEAQAMICGILLANSMTLPGRVRTYYLILSFSYSGGFTRWNLLPGNIGEIESIQCEIQDANQTRILIIGFSHWQSCKTVHFL